MSDNMNSQFAWLIGTGNIAREHAKVLKALGVDFLAIGRSEESTKKFADETGSKVISGGIQNYLTKKPDLPDFVINAVQAELGSETICFMIENGVRKILAEKPSGLTLEELKRNRDVAQRNDAILKIGYNRRFYASTIAAEEIISQDGGVSSFNFEFTELYRVIGSLKGDVSGWFYANSTHVIDLAFHLGGEPKEMTSYVQCPNPNYTSTTSFAGAGISTKNALFSYQANYLAPGRWGVEILTPKSRLIFRPMEQLQIQKLGSMAIEPVEIDDELDKRFKPGFYRQIETFIKDPSNPRFLDIGQQVENVQYYQKIHDGAKAGSDRNAGGA